MENYFAKVGQLICDLEAGNAIDDTAIGQFLNEEFREMLLQLSMAWVENRPGASYLLEFHREECARLLGKINAMHGLFTGFRVIRAGREHLQDLFRLLIDHLNIQSVRIDKLMMEPCRSRINDINLN